MNKLQWNLNRNLYIFIKENAFENVVWKMAAMLSRPQWVKWENQGAGGCGSEVNDGCKYENAGPECTVMTGQTSRVEQCL